MVDLSVEVGSLRLANPIMPGSGTFGEHLVDVLDVNQLGAIVTKTITADEREGNPPPRIAEFRDAVLWSIGIPSKGSEHYASTIVPFYSRFNPPLVASISADTVEDFGALAAAISVPGVAAIEANISCPNLRKDGLAFAMDTEATEQVIRSMKSATTLPVWAKLTPNVGDIAASARAAEAGGADALVVANAFVAMAIDVATRKSRLGRVMGGLTGPALKPIILRMVYQCAQAVKIPIIGCGGVSNANDALEFLMAGATAVQVGTASFLSAHTMPRIIAELRRYCELHGIERIRELTGSMIEPAEVRIEEALSV